MTTDPFAAVPQGTPHVIPSERNPCVCGSRRVHWVMSNGQRIARCDRCSTYVYSVPNHEVGEGPRKVRASSAERVDRTQRARLRDRDGLGCVLCGETAPPLHAGHLISVKEGRAHGLTDEQLWSDINLVVMCESCNLTLSSRSVSLQFIVALRIEWERRNA